MTNVRPAEADDIVQLAELWFEAWRYGHAHLAPPALIEARTVASFAERLAAALPDTFMAAPKQVPAGFFILRGDELYQFFVARSARGSGFAASLIAAAEAELARRGAVIAWLVCAVGNDRAGRFYEKSGWRNVRTQVNRLETAHGVFEIKHWRYEKRVAAAGIP